MICKGQNCLVGKLKELNFLVVSKVIKAPEWWFWCCLSNSGVAILEMWREKSTAHIAEPEICQIPPESISNFCPLSCFHPLTVCTLPLHKPCMVITIFTLAVHINPTLEGSPHTLQVTITAQLNKFCRHCWSKPASQIYLETWRCEFLPFW